MDILNSQMFQISDINDDIMTLSGDDALMKVKTAEFHKWFYLGFCITIHASQGETYHQKYTIHDWKHPCFCEKAKYVAMSRSSDIANIQIRL